MTYSQRSTLPQTNEELRALMSQEQVRESSHIEREEGAHWRRSAAAARYGADLAQRFPARVPAEIAVAVADEQVYFTSGAPLATKALDTDEQRDSDTEIVVESQGSLILFDSGHTLHVQDERDDVITLLTTAGVERSEFVYVYPWWPIDDDDQMGIRADRVLGVQAIKEITSC